MELTDRAAVRGLLSRYGFTFSKSMGQNFLVNPSVAPRMAEACGAKTGVGVLEIWPGIGVLTRALAQRAQQVVSLELDGRLLPILAETLRDYDNVRVLCADAMEADLEEIVKTYFAGLEAVVCANLPYYITTPILMRLLESRLPVSAVTVMVQREAAVRLCAAPGERACGAISAAVRYYSRPEILFGVSSGSFMPEPKVDSCVIRLDILNEPPVRPKDEAMLFSVVRAAFGQRRKTAVNAISAMTGANKPALAALFSSLGIDAAIRAERLTLEQFSKIADGMPDILGG